MRSPSSESMSSFQTARLHLPASVTMSKSRRTVLPLSRTSKTRWPGSSPGGAEKPSRTV